MGLILQSDFFSPVLGFSVLLCKTDHKFLQIRSALVSAESKEQIYFLGKTTRAVVLQAQDVNRPSKKKILHVFQLLQLVLDLFLWKKIEVLRTGHKDNSIILNYCYLKTKENLFTTWMASSISLRGWGKCSAESFMWAQV